MHLKSAGLLMSMLENGDSIVGEPGSVFFAHARPPSAADDQSITWISPKNSDPRAILLASRAAVVVCGREVEVAPHETGGRCVFRVNNPRLFFARAVSRFLPEVEEWAVHSSAVIHPQCQLGAPVSIGAFVHVGRAVIGNHCAIGCHAHVGDRTVLEDRVVLDAGVLVGVVGMGFERTEEGAWEEFPQRGGVHIAADVQIGSASIVARGALGDTVIGPGTKIGPHPVIGHNVQIGRNVIITASATLLGSVVIEDGVWIAPGVVIRQGVKIGREAFLGLGALVMSDVPAGGRVAGRPAVTLPKGVPAVPV